MNPENKVTLPVMPAPSHSLAFASPPHRGVAMRSPNPSLVRGT